MITTYDTQPETTLHPLDDALLAVELACDSRTRALARLVVQQVWTEQVTADDYHGNVQVIYRGQE